MKLLLWFLKSDSGSQVLILAWEHPVHIQNIVHNEYIYNSIHTKQETSIFVYVAPITN